MTGLSERIANRIYDALVEHAVAMESERGQFVRAHTDADDEIREWRFGGRLGFGGKFWMQRWVVTCYREDETVERRRIIDRTNAALADIATSNAPEEPT